MSGDDEQQNSVANKKAEEMRKFTFIAEHPILTIVSTIIPIAALIISALALIEPKYEWVEDGKICGFTETTEKTQPHEWKECDNINKIIGYKYSETVEASSGWVSGGSGKGAQSWHCNNTKRAKEAAVGASIHWEKLKSWEQSKKDFLGHVTYNYHCKLRAEWGPIYKKERHRGCGKADPVIDTVSVPNSCYDESRRIGWKFRWQ